VAQLGAKFCNAEILADPVLFVQSWMIVLNLFLTKQNVEVLFIITISDIFSVIMTMMFMLMMRTTMMIIIRKSLREVAKAQQEMSFKIYFANYLRIKR